ncbi:MAG: LysR family transcriptional regulator [Treponema sp.]|nr:LysR family transcriptional regulator [Treponema sp.]
MDIEMLRERARIIRQVRAFFDQRDYLETDTPLLAPSLIPESCLEVFQTSRLQPAGSRKPPQPYWLIPSPEVWMKRLLAQHQTSLYQICKCFRNGESSGRQHSPEFTMLEYYTVQADYSDSLELTEELFAFLLKNETVGHSSGGALSPPFIRMTVAEAFQTWAGFDLYRAAAEEGALEEQARRLGLNPPPGLSVHELYDIIFVHAVEPMINLDRPVALLDYPAFVPCLAKKSGGGNADSGETVERWELYARGLELANCFSEETDAQAVCRFFESEKSAKETSAIVPHAVDDDYWKIFAGKSFPQCSGVAMGLDRLIMLLCGRKTVDGVLPFPME